MKHVFISYAHEDCLLAIRLAEAFHRSGVVEPFIDEVGLRPSARLAGELGRALQTAEAVIVLISRASVISDWVLEEVTTAKAFGSPIYPLIVEETQWPGEVQLLIGRLKCFDATQDPDHAIGTVPKLFAAQLATDRVEFGAFAPLRDAAADSPHIQFFPGTVEGFWANRRFGRTAVVVPTDPYLNLYGKVSQSVLQALGVSADELVPSKQRITSAEVATFTCKRVLAEPLIVIAATVFNQSGEPQARDQWNAAEAILERAEELKCSLVVVPPLGTGAFNWPVAQAVVNWTYGAVRWAARHYARTNQSVWPVVCIPSTGDQLIVGDYLRLLTAARRQALAAGQWGLRIRHGGQTSSEVVVPDDAELQSVAKRVSPAFKGSAASLFRHGKGITRRRSQQVFQYHGTTRLDRTILADGDTLELIAV